MREISDDLLIQLAGDAAFARGTAYYHEGRVGELHHKGKTITALVEGGETYQVTLKHTSKVFEGICDCPASDGFDFCKHCVATALAYRDSLQQDRQLRTASGKDRLPSYLMTLDKQALVNLLLEQLKNDRNTLAELQIKADLAAGKLNAGAIKKQITAATPLNRHLFDYARVRRYFATLDSVLENLQPILPDLPADKALAVIDYAFERIDRALQTIDDSGGFRLDALQRLSELHCHILAAAAMPPEKLVDYLYTLFNSPVYDLYPNIPAAYEDILGEEGRQQFLTHVREAWDALPPLQERDWDKQSYYRHLRTPLEAQAQREGDGETLIELHAKTAVDFNDYLRLSKLCLQHDLPEQALVWRKRAETILKKNYHGQKLLENNQIDIWLYHKEYAPVVDLLWQRFAKEPSVEHYRQITAIPDQKDSKQNRSQAITLAEAATQNPNAWIRQVAANTVAELHLLFGQAEQALAVAETRKLKPELLVEVACANPKYPERGLPLIYRSVRTCIDQGDNRHYRKAIDMLKQVHTLAGKKQQANFRAALNEILEEYKRKRNFCQWTREAFAELL